MTGVTPAVAKQRELLKTLQELKRRRREQKLDYFQPYDKQRQFFDLGISKRERLFMAGNQLGKTESGAYETSLHLTGEYPDWWLGRRWERATIGWAAGETGTVVRDVQQRKLCGPPGVTDDFGTGMIPKRLFVDKPSLARGVTDAFDTIQVKHKSGGTSILRFKSYEQGRAKFQGDTLDFAWCDEEPPMDVYAEILTRMTASDGMVFITFTPLNGPTNVVIRYTDELSEDRAIVIMVIEEALHIDPVQRQKIIAGYLPHEREARARGVPMLGEGRIFTTAEDAVQEPLIPHDRIPMYWPKLWGIDFGIGHPFAAVLLAWDRDNDVVHILHSYRIANTLPIIHAQAMKRIGANVPVAWPQDGTHREAGSGEALSTLYKQNGLLMLPDPATHETDGVSTEAGVEKMRVRFEEGKLKVAAHLAEFFDEYRMYHRKAGKIVKLKDDILSATRVAIMMLRCAKAVNLGPLRAARRKDQRATGVDFNPWNPEED